MPRPMRTSSMRTRLGLTLAVSSLAALTVPATATAAGPPDPAAGQFLVGRGIGDVTGEVAEVGLMGYASIDQTGAGLLSRQYARAFVIVDPSSGRRVVHVTADLGMVWQSIRDGVLAKLTQKYGDTYTESNVMITATHTHSSTGGDSHHALYDITTVGHHPKTLQARVDGIVEAIERADADVAPATLGLGTAQLTNASVNRSRTAFDRNPAADKAHFPNAVDSASTTLSITRNGAVDGTINWFGVHATSLTNQNRLVSSDNKGYAAYDRERLDHGVDLVAGSPSFVAAFPQSNAGDMSPNLNLRPGSGPTEDQYDNARIIGTRMADAAEKAQEGSQRALPGGVDSRIIYVNMADQRIQGRFTPDGQEHSTCSATYGVVATAGSTEDGPALPIVKEGKDGGNPLAEALSNVLYGVNPALAACQAPKAMLADVGALDFTQQRLPVQVFRIGDEYLVGVPFEVTVVSGLRLRQTLAKVMGTTIDHVLVQGYANAYGHYLTTPEEYDSGEYEGGSTLYGRYQLPAVMQVVDGLARDLQDGTTRPIGTKERNRTAEQWISPTGVVVADDPQIGRRFGDVLSAPNARYTAGEQVSVTFSGAHPNNNLHRGGTYLAVERLEGGTWTRVADDNDWATRFLWKRDGISASKATITWQVGASTPAGTYRIRYFGDARNFWNGQINPISGTSPNFQVTT